MKYRVLIVFLLVFALTGCGAFGKATPEALPTVVLGNGTPGPANAPSTSSGGVIASGIVAPSQQSQLVFTIGGRVKSIQVEVGDQVDAGEVLVELEGQESLQAAVSAAQFELEQAQQALDALQTDLDVQQAQALKTIADSEVVVRDAQRVVTNLTSNAQQVDLDAASANMILAKDRLERAREDYKPYENKPEDNPVRAALLSKVAQAQKTYDALVRTYNNLLGNTNPLDLNQAEAKLALAEAQLAKAQRDYEILKLGPDPDKVRLAEARRFNAQTQLSAAQASLTNLTLVAPFAGTLAKININNGEWVVPGQVVLVLADLGNLRVETTDLGERDIPQVEVGQSVTVNIEALGQDIAGEVSAISPLADTLGGDVVYKVTIVLQEPPAGLRAGMSVEVQFEAQP